MRAAALGGVECETDVKEQWRRRPDRKERPQSALRTRSERAQKAGTRSECSGDAGQGNDERLIELGKHWGEAKHWGFDDGEHWEQ